MAGPEGGRETLLFYSKIRENLCKFVTGEELKQSSKQDSVIVPVGHNVILDNDNLLEEISNPFE